MEDAAYAAKDGLSPLARGTHDTEEGAVCIWRFIPAGAGNTREFHRPLYSLRVYPRWRGEHALDGLGDVVDTGLSPLARGTLRASVIAAADHRFIPAGAGNTWITAGCCI